MQTDQVSTTPPRRSIGPSPARAPGSLRRTTSVDVSWPEGHGGPIRVSGRARDLFSGETAAGDRIVAQDSFEAIFGPDWKLLSIAASPARDGLDALIGQRGSGGFRKALNQVIPDEQANASPLALLLDDIPGAVLVSSVAWSEWDPDWKRKAFGDRPIEELLKAREGVCIGHAAGSSAQNQLLSGEAELHPTAAELVRADDPSGWHNLSRQEGPGFRRVRRIDLRVGDRIEISSEFQDSATRPGGGRFAVHEYGLDVTADPRTLELLSLAVQPRVLPYAECPSVAPNLLRLRGQRIDDMRQAVPAALSGAVGCTHLNDALRALADVPVLLPYLD